MATQSMTYFDDALRTVYRDNLIRQLNDEIYLYRKLKKTSKNIVGKEVRKHLSIGRNIGVAAGSETGALPIAGKQSYDQIVITLKKIFGCLEISSMVIEASRSKQGAVASALTEEMKGLARDFKWQISRQLYNDQYGTIAKCGITSNSKTVVLASTGTQPIRFIVGMPVNILVRANGNKGTGDDQETVITAVSTATPSITVNRAAVTTDATYGVYRHGAYGLELTGLQAWVGTTGNTIGGIDRSTADWFNPIVMTNGGTLRSISQDLMQQAIDECDIRGMGKTDLILTTHGIRRKYTAAEMARVRHVDEMELDGGQKAVAFGGIPLVVDNLADKNGLYFLDLSTFELNQYGDMDWMDRDGSILKHKAGFPIYTAVMQWFAELTCDKPAANVWLGDITE